MPIPSSSRATAAANGPAAPRRSLPQRLHELVDASLCLGQRLGSGGYRIRAVGERGQLDPGSGRPLDELCRGRRAMTAPEVGEVLELGLHLLEAAGIGLERRQVRPNGGSGIAQPHPDVAQLTRRLVELLRDAGHSLQRDDRLRGELHRSLSVVRRERRHGSGGGLGQLGHVAQPLPLGPQLLLALHRYAFGVLDERAQLGEPLRRRRRPADEVVVHARAPPGARARPPRSRARRRSCSSPQNASSTSSWYDGRASRRCSNWPDIATSRSVAAATSSRAAARPQA